jgi:hypothetical protein
VRFVAIALAHAVVTRSGKRSCGPVGLERSVRVRRVTKRVASASGDAEGEAIFPQTAQTHHRLLSAPNTALS